MAGAACDNTEALQSVNVKECSASEKAGSDMHASAQKRGGPNRVVDSMRTASSATQLPQPLLPLSRWMKPS